MTNTHPDHTEPTLSRQSRQLIERQLLAGLAEAEEYAALYFGPRRNSESDDVWQNLCESYRYWVGIVAEIRQALAEIEAQR